MDDNAAAKANTTAAGTQHGVSKDGDARHVSSTIFETRASFDKWSGARSFWARIPIAQPGACPARPNPNIGRP